MERLIRVGKVAPKDSNAIAKSRIAQAAWYFGTDASKNVTGAELLVDGGMSCQLYPVKLNEWKRIAKEK